MLLTFILQVRGCVHQRECFVMRTFCVGGPSGSTQPLHLHFGSPVIVLGSFEAGHDALEFLHLFFRANSVAGAGGAESARKVWHRVCLWELTRA